VITPEQAIDWVNSQKHEGLMSCKTCQVATLILRLSRFRDPWCPNCGTSDKTVVGQTGFCYECIHQWSPGEAPRRVRGGTQDYWNSESI